MSLSSPNTSPEAWQIVRQGGVARFLATGGDATGTLLTHEALERIRCSSAEHGVRDVIFQVLDWVKNYLCSQNAELVGRPGPVCPWIPGAIGRDSLYYAQVDSRRISLREVVSTMMSLQVKFMELAPTKGDPGFEHKALIAAFVDLPRDLVDDYIVQVHHHVLKSRFVEQTLMLGEFHPDYDLRGTHNPDFRAGLAPAPLLAIRPMVRRDGVFLSDNPEWLRAHMAAFPIEGR